MVDRSSLTAGEQALSLFALPVAAQLKMLSEDKPDIFQMIGESFVLRVPKFSDVEISLACYARLPQLYREFVNYVDIAIPRFATIVAEGLVPPMKEPGPVNYMIVERIEGDPLDSVVATGGVPGQQLEGLLVGLAVYLHRSAISHTEFVEDLFHLDQYMYGTTNSDANERIWLTDLEPRYLRLTAEPSAFDPMPIFLMQAAELIKSLLFAERHVGQTLTLARRSIEQLLAHIETIDPSAAIEMRDTLHCPDSDGNYYQSAWFRRR